MTDDNDAFLSDDVFCRRCPKLMTAETIIGVYDYIYIVYKMRFFDK